MKNTYKKKYHPVVVIYNEKCVSSPSIKKLVELDVPPLVVDNSDKEMGNREWCGSAGIDYISMGGNAGLPRAYNSAAEYIFQHRNPGLDDYILWFDDDTDIPDDYFRYMDEANGMILAPVVRTNNTGRIISPCVIDESRKYRFRPVRDAGEGPIISAINSGLCVNSAIYNNYRYDENLFLDCVDHDFMLSMKEKGITAITVADAVLFQNYSGDEKKSRASALKRRKIFVRDYRYIGIKWGIPRWLVEKRIFNNLIMNLITGHE